MLRRLLLGFGLSFVVLAPSIASARSFRVDEIPTATTAPAATATAISTAAR
jgi:hypothetical protein